jgi:hypothetical protein
MPFRPGESSAGARHRRAVWVGSLAAMAYATIVTIGSGQLIEPLAQAVAEGADSYGTQVSTHHLDTVGDSLPAELIEDLGRSVGAAIGSSLAPDDTEAQMTAFNRLAMAAINPSELSVRVATSFTSLAKDDPAAGEAVDRMNRLLYRWGAVIVSPGYADGPVVDWLDNRPGVDMRAGDDTTLGAASVDAAKRQGRRLGALVGMIASAISRLERLQL